MATFTDSLIRCTRDKQSILCVGLDPQLRFMPPHLVATARVKFGPTFEAIGWLFTEFNRKIIDAILPFASSVKPQIAFYEKYGPAGLQAFCDTVNYARGQGLVVIEDGKRGDGGDTAEAYAEGHLGEVDFWDSSKAISPIRVDALTVHGYIGTACIAPFVAACKEYGTGIFVVTKTSFAPNSEIEQLVTIEGMTVWQAVATLVSEWGKGTEGEYGYRNVGVVMGATYPEDAPRMRKILPRAYFLVPGYGEQGGGADGAVVGCNQDGLGCEVNSSRGITYAYRKGKFQAPSEDFATSAARAAEFGKDDLNAALKRAGKFNF